MDFCGFSFKNVRIRIILFAIFSELCFYNPGNELFFPLFLIFRLFLSNKKFKQIKSIGNGRGEREQGCWTVFDACSFSWSMKMLIASYSTGKYGFVVGFSFFFFLLAENSKLK